MVVLVDEEDRENEGDLVIAADFVTPEAINFMAQARARPGLPHARREERCRQLGLPPMVARQPLRRTAPTSRCRSKRPRA